MRRVHLYFISNIVSLQILFSSLIFEGLVCLAPFPEQLVHYIHLSATFQSSVWCCSDIKCTFGLVTCLFYLRVFVCKDLHARESILESTWISQMAGKFNAFLKCYSQPFGTGIETRVRNLAMRNFNLSLLILTGSAESLGAIRYDRNTCFFWLDFASWQFFQHCPFEHPGKLYLAFKAVTAD